MYPCSRNGIQNGYSVNSSQIDLQFQWKVKVAQSFDSLQPPHELKPARLLCPWNYPGKNTGVGSRSLLQGIQGLNRGLLHCRQILYHLSHKSQFWWEAENWHMNVTWDTHQGMFKSYKHNYEWKKENIEHDYINLKKGKN